MKIHTLHKTQFLPIALEEAWQFFSTPLNLAKITPPDLGFEVLTPFKATDTINEGMLIEYYVKPLFGIRVKWVTKIGEINKPYSFVDNQLKGPYSLWEHTHYFKAVNGGVEMTDVVKYSLPLGIIGEIGHELLVKKKLETIFSYRKKTLDSLFQK